MTDGSSSQSFKFTVSDIAVRGVPTSVSITNEFDYFGSLLGLKRFPEEKNAGYKKRLLDVFVNRANSTYTGLVNGLTRELDFEFFKPITLSLRGGLDPSWSPRIEFKDNKIYIWKDYITQLLDLEIDRSDSALPEYFLKGLVSKINTSSVFSAVLDSLYAEYRSDTIVNSSSSKLITVQQLATSSKNYLGISNIERGSISFTNNNTFGLEVSSLGAVNSTGKYYVDYQSGLITSFDIPSNNISIRYSYTETPFIPKASPVIVRSVSSAEFQSVMFNQVVQEDGTFVNGTATIKGSQIVNELMSVIPIYWGE